MVNTRVEKYKEYRRSLIKEGAAISHSQKERQNHDESLSTTTTLPIEQVIDSLNEDNAEVMFLKKRLKKKYTTISALIICGVVILAIIIIIAVLLFRR